MPDTDAAKAVTDLLLPLGVGSRDPALDVDLTWAADVAKVDPYTALFRNDGFTVTHGPTLATARPDAVAGSGGTGWEQILETAINYSSDGLTAGGSAGEEFDVAFTISTNNLNQILLERSKTAIMNFTVPLGGTGTSDGSAMGDMLAAPLELRVSPGEQPFTWMIPDALGSVPGVSPVVYHMMDLKADLVRPGTGGTPDEILVNMVLDFLAPSIGISLNNAGAEYLDVGLGNSHVDLKIMNSNVPGCPMEPHGSGHAASCEGIAEALFEDLIEPSLKELAGSMLSEIPGPHLFDAGGRAAACDLADMSNFQAGQRVTIYADLAC